MDEFDARRPLDEFYVLPHYACPSLLCRGHVFKKCRRPRSIWVSFSLKPFRTPWPRESEDPQIRQKQNVKILKFARISKVKRYISKVNIMSPKVNLRFPKVNLKCFLENLWRWFGFRLGLTVVGISKISNAWGVFPGKQWERRRWPWLRALPKDLLHMWSWSSEESCSRWREARSPWPRFPQEGPATHMVMVIWKLLLQKTTALVPVNFPPSCFLFGEPGTGMRFSLPESG